MSTNYFRFAIRIFLKEKFYTLLNIIGLATGIAVSIIILLYLQNDLTYDMHHEKYRQIYRMVTNVKGPGVEFHAAQTAREVPSMLEDDYPEIISFVRLQRIGTTLIQVPGGKENALYNEKDILKADSTMFDVFTHSFIVGNPHTALNELHSIVLTQELASKYFGTAQEALGKTLLVGDAKENYTVTGVIENLPDNSHLKFDGLLSHIDTREWAIRDGEFNSEAIWNPDVYTYLLFPEGYNTADFFAKFQPFYDRYIKPFGDVVDSKLWYYLEPLADVHFKSTQETDEPQGNIAYVYAFGAIGLFILLLACINYMNMATARAGKRTKEIGVRKVMGSSKKRLILSFLSESFLLAFIAMIVSLCLVAFILYASPFNSLIEKQLTLNFIHNPLLLFGTLGITFLIGLISGLYPAFYLPNIGVIQSLKGSFKPGSSGSLRKVLVGFQFIISIAVVICTLLMKEQIDFVRNKELGFNKEHLLLVNIPDTLVQKQIPVIKNEMLHYSGIAGVTVAYNAPGIGVGSQVFKVETDSVMTQQVFNSLFVGENYLETMGIKLLAGRDFNEGFEGDKDGNSFLINETAAKALGWYKAADKNSALTDALGKEIMFFHGDNPGHVVGIIQDINLSSLHNPIQPTIIVPAGEEGGMFYFRLQGENLPETMDFIRNKWAAYDPNHPFEYRFLDEEFDALYRADERQSNLISILSGICLVVSLLGVLGLSAFTAEQRTKEIGVRKVLGASIPQIVYLLFRDVMYLVIIASVLAAPLAYYITSLWLENFAFRADMNLSLFLLAGLSALAIAFLIMSFHSIKTARLNPVVSLRYE